jgi:hypothetical protein
VLCILSDPTLLLAADMTSLCIENHVQSYLVKQEWFAGSWPKQGEGGWGGRGGGEI